jgi:hypothetical protein
MERVGGDVARELGRFGTATALAPIVEAWPTAVGSEIARNAWPARLARDGTLHVHTSSAAWAFELRQLEARVRASLGEESLLRLRFAVGPLPEPEPDAFGEAMSRVVKPSSQHAAAAAELTAQIGDEKLRKVVAKTAALSLAKADSDRLVW